MHKTVALADLKTREPFVNLFPTNQVTLDAIAESMRQDGFDPSKPLDVWKTDDGLTVVDGHTRLAAASLADLETVETYVHHFHDEDAALEYAIRNQRDRRNLTAAEILRCVQVLDKRHSHGAEPGGRGNQYTSGKASADALPPADIPLPQPPANGKSAEQTAALLGVSPSTIERARTVNDHAPEPVKQAVENGEMSIRKAAEVTQVARRDLAPEQTAKPETKPTFNKTNENIEWATWTWNPVTGCKHGCPYCYARDIAARFDSDFSPRFHPNRLTAPTNTKVPAGSEENIGLRNVFVCSMADLFGEWVPQEWIDKTLDACRENPQWNYLFLSKNPSRMQNIDWPRNAWVGTTIDCQDRVAGVQPIAKSNAYVKFVSCEPLRERLDFGPDGLDAIDWVIIGGQSKSTGEPERQPEWEWVEHLQRQARAAKCAVYWKPNLTVRPREYPGTAVGR